MSIFIFKNNIEKYIFLISTWIYNLVVYLKYLYVGMTKLFISKLPNDGDGVFR